MEVTKMQKSEYSTEAHKLRPISPHLSIYKPQLTSTLSIFHRITGSILVFLVVFGIISYKIYSYYGSYSCISGTWTSINDNFDWLLSTIYFMFLLSLYYHTCNGIRHLMWDMGYGLDLKTIYFTGYLVVAISVLLTISTWLLPALF